MDSTEVKTKKKVPRRTTAEPHTVVLDRQLEDFHVAIGEEVRRTLDAAHTQIQLSNQELLQAEIRRFHQKQAQDSLKHSGVVTGASLLGYLVGHHAAKHLSMEPNGCGLLFGAGAGLLGGSAYAYLRTRK